MAQLSESVRNRLATLLLFGWPVLLIALIGAAVLARQSGLTLSPWRSIPEAVVSSGIEEPPRIYEAAHPTATPSAALARHDLEGMSLEAVAAMSTDATVFVFAKTVHAAPLEPASGGVPATATVHAADQVRIGRDRYVLLRIDDPPRSASASETRTWWYPGHPQDVASGGVAPCFTCHMETVCSYCHVKMAAGYLDAQSP